MVSKGACAFCGGSAVCPSSEDRAKQETGWVLAGSLHGD